MCNFYSDYPNLFTLHESYSEPCGFKDDLWEKYRYCILMQKMYLDNIQSYNYYFKFKFIFIFYETLTFFIIKLYVFFLCFAHTN